MSNAIITERKDIPREFSPYLRRARSQMNKIVEFVRSYFHDTLDIEKTLEFIRRNDQYGYAYEDDGNTEATPMRLDAYLITPVCRDTRYAAPEMWHYENDNLSSAIAIHVEQTWRLRDMKPCSSAISLHVAMWDGNGDGQRTSMRRIEYAIYNGVLSRDLGDLLLLREDHYVHIIELVTQLRDRRRVTNGVAEVMKRMNL
jgi:hypothetical protein